MSSRSSITLGEFFSVRGFLRGEQFREATGGDRSLLEPLLVVDRHREAGDLLHAALDDLPLQLVQRFVLPVGQFDERNSFGS